MTRGMLQIAVGFLLLSHTATDYAQAQSTAKRIPVKIIYSALTASNGPFGWPAIKDSTKNMASMFRSFMAGALHRSRHWRAERWSSAISLDLR